MEAQFALLKQFVAACKATPELIHHPQLAFYREYLESLGATLPPKPEEKKPAPPPKEEKKAEEPPVVEEKVEEIPRPALDESGVIPADDGAALPMGDEAAEPDFEKASSEREAAQAAFSDGDAEKALAHYTAAIEANGSAAALFAKRAQVLLKLARPVAAIRDCDRAIALNADSAAAYKFRGRAHRLLGHWVEAHTDLAQACKIDYDDAANEWLKEVEPNAKKLKEYNRAVERQREERELNERRERVRRAQEANAKAKKEAEERGMQDGDDMDFGGAGFGGGMPGGPDMGAFAQMFNDPDIQKEMQDPVVMTAILDIMKNPQNLMKHMGNEKVMRVFAKLQGMFGGGAPGGPTGHCGAECGDEACGGGAPHEEEPAKPAGGCPMGGGASKAPPSSSAAAPQPDLD